MPPLLLLLLYCWCHVGASPGYSDSTPDRDYPRPYIYYCRSPTMETFTCWWHPLDNNLQGDDKITYRFIYKLGNQSPAECPDYVSGGPNSCYFDMKHTDIWEVYCMNVTAYTKSSSFTSNEHCVDVADIVQVDPPFNLTYTLMNTSKDEAGHAILVSWQYPIAEHVQIGWITLVYELRYRDTSEPNNWKVKERLREPQLEIIELPYGNYEVQVRCRSFTSKRWSEWSSPVNFTIPSSHQPDNILIIVLITIILVILLVVIGIGFYPKCMRIKDVVFPPIPKPCIRGIDPILLKDGNMDEIDHHFFSLQGYKRSHHCEESVYYISVDESVSLTQMSSTSSIQEDLEMPDTQNPICTENQQLLDRPDSPSPYCQDPAYTCNKPSVMTLVPETPLWACAEKSSMQPELLSFPGTDYSMIVNPDLKNTPPTAQEFYACVHGVTTNEMVQLVPCMSDLKDKTEEETKKLCLEKRVDGQDNEITFCPEEEQNEYVVPFLPPVTKMS